MGSVCYQLRFQDSLDEKAFQTGPQNISPVLPESVVITVVDYLFVFLDKFTRKYQGFYSLFQNVGMLKRLKQLNLAENKIEKIGNLIIILKQHYFSDTEFTIENTVTALAKTDV